MKNVTRVSCLVTRFRATSDERRVTEFMFNIIILNPKKVLFEGMGKSVFLQGDRGEFEVMPYHCSIVSLLKAGSISIDAKKRLKIKGGIAKFHNNELVVLVEE